MLIVLGGGAASAQELLMFRMDHPYQVHVVRADGTSHTQSGHRVARGALRSITAFTKPWPDLNPKYVPRSVQVWCAVDNKSWDCEAFREHVKSGYYK